MNKLPCKLRREGWRTATSDGSRPDGVGRDDILDVLFWNDKYSNGSPANSLIWGWSGITGKGFTIKCWRPSNEI